MRRWTSDRTQYILHSLLQETPGLTIYTYALLPSSAAARSVKWYGRSNTFERAFIHVKLRPDIAVNHVTVLSIDSRLDSVPCDNELMLFIKIQSYQASCPSRAGQATVLQSMYQQCYWWCDSAVNDATVLSMYDDAGKLFEFRSIEHRFNPCFGCFFFFFLIRILIKRPPIPDSKVRRAFSVKSKHSVP